MRLTLVEEGLEFNFPKAKALYKFDDPHNNSPTYHGVSTMKAVDVMAEFDKFQLWIEIKQYQDSEIEDMREEGDQKRPQDKIHRKAYLTQNFKLKFRDTWLYRWCERKEHLPIVFICLTNFDHALNLYYKKELIKQLPSSNANRRRWDRCLIEKEKVWVMDLNTWERNCVDKFGTCQRIHNEN